MSTNEPKQTDSRAANAGETVPSDSKQSGENVCRRCKGSGRIDGKPCDECGGSGKVTTLVGDA